MKITNALQALALFAALVSSLTWAQYPTKPIRLVVPFAAGGPTDGVARTMAQALTKSLGQPVVVENKPGADGAISAQAVAGAAPDGYTLLFASSSQLGLPYLVRPAPFDTLADFLPVTTIGRFAFCMYVHPSVPSRTMAEFIAHARSNPGKLNLASNNMGEHMAATQFMRKAGIEMVRVPYKGAAQSIPDLVAGRVQVMFAPVSVGLAHVKEGRLRMLAVLDSQRSSALPEVATMEEAGVAGVFAPAYQMILAPAKTPREIVDRLSREANAAMKDPGVVALLERQFLAVEGMTPQAHGALIRDLTRAWAEFARENAVAPQ
ncbi:MAG TPA: tripartite tricarboxylate transporter substrate binding protein [Opitutaceae bacterium]|nr:tripartite tricarboxylate transporter substrate binding protein [Opitutaceae bacterium]